MAEETEKITYEIVVDDSQAKGAADNVAKGLGKVSESADKAKASTMSFSEGLNKMVPGLGGVVSGFQGMVKGALAFIATPIGAVVAALGAALGALTKYFKGSEEGQDRLAKVMAIGGVVFDKVTVIVENLGKVVFDTLEFMASGFKSVIDFFAPAIGKMLDEAIDAGSKIAKLQDDIDSRENELIVKRAETNKLVSELRTRAITLEGKEKRDVIAEAIKLEEELSAANTEQINNRLILLEKEVTQRGDATEEEKKQIAELTATKINAETEATGNTIRLRKELEALDDQLRKDKQLADEEDAQVKLRAQEFDTEQELATNEIKLLNIKKLSDAGINASLANLKAKEDAAKKENELEKQKTKISELENQQRLATTSRTLGLAQGLFKQDTIAYKALAIARTYIDTFSAATEALPNVFLAGLVTALGLANVANIIGVQFARGGVLDGPSHRQGGIPFTVGGKKGFEAEGGEAIINKRSTAMFRDQLSAINAAGGGVRFETGGVTPFATAGISNQIASERIFQKMVEVMQATSQKVLVIEDFESLQEVRDTTRARATV